MSFRKHFYIVLFFLILLSVPSYGMLGESGASSTLSAFMSQPFSSSSSLPQSSFPTRNRDALFLNNSSLSTSSIYDQYLDGEMSGAVVPAIYTSPSEGISKSLGNGLLGISGLFLSTATTSFRSAVSDRSIFDNIGASAPATVMMYGAAPPPPPGGGSTDPSKQLPIADALPVLLVFAAAYALVILHKNKTCLAHSSDNA